VIYVNLISILLKMIIITTVLKFVNEYITCCM